MLGFLPGPKGSGFADDLGKVVDNKLLDAADNALSSSKLSFKTGDALEVDASFLEGAGNLNARLDVGWFDGETAYIDVVAVYKDRKYSGKLFSNLTAKMEAIAKENGLSNVRIDFSLVHNSRLKTDASWAQEYGYHFSSETDKFETTVTWEKTLDSN